jgi:hypothetical protein
MRSAECDERLQRANASIWIATRHARTQGSTWLDGLRPIGVGGAQHSLAA